MSFDRLLGNTRLKANLSAAIARGHISHFYLISGPVGSGKHTLAKLLAQALLCTGSSKPCGTCQDCRKVLSGSHPDFITVEDTSKKNLPVSAVREARADMYVMPNEGSRKIYLFPQAMGVEGQNALLKILEEPPQYGVFILLSENPETLLPTVRSRCTHLPLTAVSEEELKPWLKQRFPQAEEAAIDAAIFRSGGFPGQALTLLQEGASLTPETEKFLKAFTRRDAMTLLQTLVPMEKWKRDQLIPELEQWKGLLQQALVCRSGMQPASTAIRDLAASRSSSELLGAIRALQKTVEYAQGNVSCAAICGYLEWSLR